MRRPVLILMALALGGLVLALGAFRMGSRLGSAHMARSTDDLEWLRLEFRLDDQEMARIRQLHEGYAPQCQAFCSQIAAHKRELGRLLPTGTNASLAVDRKLAEIARVRAQCQAAMLRHFGEVSRAMPPAQGKRYLAEMERLTLGAHESIEQSMAPPSTPAHDHH